MERTIEMKAWPRTERGKNAMRRLRSQGHVPAVLYGLGKDSVPVSLETKAITRIVSSRSGHNQILDLAVDGGEKVAVLAVDWQLDPVQGSLLHVDMQRVDLKKVVTLSVQVRTVGVAIGVKEQGGVEEVVTREVEIECLPLAVPERIEIDISEMRIGSAVRVRDLPPNENYRYLTPPDRVLVHVVTPRVLEEPVVAEAAAPAEPEVIEKGKVEDKDKKEESKGEKGEKGEKGA